MAAPNLQRAQVESAFLEVWWEGVRGAPRGGEGVSGGGGQGGGRPTAYRGAHQVSAQAKEKGTAQRTGEKTRTHLVAMHGGWDDTGGAGVISQVSTDWMDGWTDRQRHIFPSSVHPESPDAATQEP